MITESPLVAPRICGSRARDWMARYTEKIHLDGLSPLVRSGVSGPKIGVSKA